MAFAITWELNGVYLKFSGIVDFDELLNANCELLGTLYYDKAFYQLWDFTSVIRVDVDVKHVNILSTMDKSSFRWNQHMMVALVTNNPVLVNFALVYMGDMAETNWLCKVFDTVEKARSWIKVDSK